MTTFSAALLLFLVLDPFGNIPFFISALKNVDSSKHNKIILWELLIALIILAAFLFAGRHVLSILHISEPSLTVAGGIILFIIALIGAWFLSGLLILSSGFFTRILGRRVLSALERLMGMILVTIAVQMLMNGISEYINSL